MISRFARTEKCCFARKSLGYTNVRLENVHSKSSKAWLQRHHRDKLVVAAKQQDLRARSAFKLLEIQQKYKLISPSSVVLDLGAAPGGWSVVASKIIQPQSGGKLVSVDLLPTDPVPYMNFIQGNFLSQITKEDINSALNGNFVTVALSDMLENVTGQKDVDHLRSISLVEDVISFLTAPQPTLGKPLLHPQGSVLCKYYRGAEEKRFVDELRKMFTSVKIIKPKSSRSESKEVYILAQNIKTP